MNDEKYYIKKYLELVEERLNWGESADWTNQDFEKLSEKIFESTNVSLSVTTLKRIWGKVKYESDPSVSTLNVLARFVDTESWRHFKQSLLQTQDSEIKCHDQLIEVNRVTVVKKRETKVVISALAVLLVVVGVAAFITYTKHKSSIPPVNPSSYSFHSTKVADGIPNSVVFNYNASMSPIDSVYIQQSWDPGRRTKVDKDKKEHTSIYYYPGFFMAKLVIGNQVVREHELLIPTEGWFAAIEQDPIPIYLKDEEYIKNRVIQIIPKTIIGHGVRMEPDIPVLSVSNVMEMKNLYNDNFIFETKVKNDFKRGASVCQRTEVMILCKNDIIFFPLVAKGCIGDLSLYITGSFISSKETDLSKFGCDLSEWTTVKVVGGKKNIQIIVNGIEAYRSSLPHSSLEVVGVTFRFHGSGAVKETRFYNNKESYNL
ncbi:MAG TPA: hypothetical protein VF691_15840 [Cytophagaceae bacterium]|jgi:hypothetical protein